MLNYNNSCYHPANAAINQMFFLVRSLLLTSAMVWNLELKISHLSNHCFPLLLKFKKLLCCRVVTQQEDTPEYIYGHGKKIEFAHWKCSWNNFSIFILHKIFHKLHKATAVQESYFFFFINDKCKKYITNSNLSKCYQMGVSHHILISVTDNVTNSVYDKMWLLKLANIRAWHSKFLCIQRFFFFYCLSYISHLLGLKQSG